MIYKTGFLVSPPVNLRLIDSCVTNYNIVCKINSFFWELFIIFCIHTKKERNELGFFHVW